MKTVEIRLILVRNNHLYMKNQLHKMLYSLGSGQYTKPIRKSDLRAVSSVGRASDF